MYFNEVLHELSQNCRLLSHRICENWEVFGVAQAKGSDAFSDDVLYYSDDLFSINKSSMPKKSSILRTDSRLFERPVYQLDSG